MIHRQSQYEAVCGYVREERGPELLSQEEIMGATYGKRS